MKIFLMIFLALGVSQGSQATTQCKNSQYQVNLWMDDTTQRCGFNVSGSAIGLSYMGHIQTVGSGIECKGIAFTESPYHFGTLNIYGETATLTFENGAPIYLRCQ